MVDEIYRQWEGGPEGSFLTPEELVGRESFWVMRYLLQIHPEITGMIFSTYKSSDSDSGEKHGKKIQYFELSREQIIGAGFLDLIDRESGWDVAFGVESVVKISPYFNALGEEISTGHLLMLDYDYNSYTSLARYWTPKVYDDLVEMAGPIEDEIRANLPGISGFIISSSDRGMHFMGTELLNYEEWTRYYFEMQERFSSDPNHHHFANQTLAGTNLKSSTLRLGYKRDTIPFIVSVI